METQAKNAEQRLSPDEVRAILTVWSEQQSVADRPTVQDVAEALDLSVSQVQALRLKQDLDAPTLSAPASSQ